MMDIFFRYISPFIIYDDETILPWLGYLSLISLTDQFPFDGHFLFRELIEDFL